MSEVVEEPGGSAWVPVVVLEATRALLRVSTAAEARQIGERLVRGLGGGFVTSRTESGSVIPADVSFGDGDPLLPEAPPGSAARSLVERYLPPYLLDANRVLELNQRGERLAVSASTDTLTGLPNRRMIDRALGRLAGGDAVVILDLDHFKLVNDEFGHTTGDVVLRAFGSVLRSAARGRDVVGRFGGEEFVAVLGAPGAGPDAFLERLRKDWLAARPLPVTFSAGVARSAGDPDETIVLADAALYAAKNAGRDQWRWATATATTTAPAATDYLEPYLSDAIVGRRPPAIRLTIDLLDNRVAPAAIVENLLAAAQREVGERWQRNELTAADEHLATGVTGAALDALAGEIAPHDSGGLTVITCAEGDWHSLAAQMVGASLRSHGMGVRVLGASTPADVVGEFLGRSDADSLAVSCSLAMFFPGAARLADAAHRQGIPVIMGGRAFGTDVVRAGRRASRLGADAWAPSAVEAVGVLTRWKTNPPPVDATPTRVNQVALRLAEEAPGLALAALAVLAATFPAMADYDQHQLDRTLEDLGYIVRFLGAATMVDDPTVLTEFLTWLQDVLTHRDVPLIALVAGLEALRPQVEAVGREAAALLDVGRRMLVDGSSDTGPAAVVVHPELC
ncbi:MAG: diguanylate cyclase [Nocardioidaceae bacterium]